MYGQSNFLRHKGNIRRKGLSPFISNEKKIEREIR